MNYFEPLSIVIDEQSVQQVQQLIENSNQILITTHLSPDGDALGASLGLYHFLKLKKKNVRLMVPNSFPYFLKWMAGTDEILIYEYNPKAAKIIFEHTDLIFSIDYNIPKRVGNMASLLENSDAKKVRWVIIFFPAIFTMWLFHIPKFHLQANWFFGCFIRPKNTMK